MIWSPEVIHVDYVSNCILKKTIEKFRRQVLERANDILPKKDTTLARYVCSMHDGNL